jgi:hypothetical protein
MNIVDDIAAKTDNLMRSLGYRAKRIRVAFPVKDTSRYDPHQGIKEREKRRKRAEVEYARNTL